MERARKEPTRERRQPQEQEERGDGGPMKLGEESEPQDLPNSWISEEEESDGSIVLIRWYRRPKASTTQAEDKFVEWFSTK